MEPQKTQVENIINETKVEQPKEKSLEEGYQTESEGLTVDPYSVKNKGK